MPCFAVTNTKATVGNDVINSLLTDDIVQKIVRATLDTVAGMTGIRMSGYTNGKWIADFHVTYNGQSMTVGIGRGTGDANRGKIVCNVQNGRESDRDTIIAAVNAGIMTAGAMLLGAQFNAALSNAGAEITGAHTKSDGTFVTNFEIEV